MVTPEQLANMLDGLSNSEVAKESGVCARTILRLRTMKCKPSIVTAAKVVGAIKKLQGKRRRSPST